MTKQLAQNVWVDGVFYAAGSTPDKGVADQIVNPKAWGTDATAEVAAPVVVSTDVIATVLDGATVDTADDDAQSYDDLTVADLKDEIDKRNEGREADAKLSKTGTKAELVAVLDADDAA